MNIMKKKLNPMDKFQFLLGSWQMDYKILKSRNILEDIGSSFYKKNIN
jgi:hypothetical protein